MNVRRLKKLAEHLRKVRSNKFDMDRWKCGTQACAFGHACDIPSFQKAGLHLQKLYPQYKDDKNLEPVFNYKSGFEAAQEFFEIDSVQADYLFDPAEYENNNRKIGPKRVASRILKFIKDKGRIPGRDVCPAEDCIDY